MNCKVSYFEIHKKKLTCCRTMLHSVWSSRILKAAPQIPPGICLQFKVIMILPASVEVKDTPMPSPAVLTYTYNIEHM